MVVFDNPEQMVKRDALPEVNLTCPGRAVGCRWVPGRFYEEFARLIIPVRKLDVSLQVDTCTLITFTLGIPVL